MNTYDETELELRMQEACHRCETELPASELATSLVILLSAADGELRRIRGLFNAIHSDSERGMKSYPHSTIPAPPWADFLEIAPKESCQIWVRWTGADGIYRWLHPVEKRWVDDPEQIGMPMFSNYGSARLAANRSPEPPNWKEYASQLSTA